MRVNLSSQPSHGHVKLGSKSAAEDRTVQAFPDLSAQNTIISDACRGAITLGDQSLGVPIGIRTITEKWEVCSDFIPEITPSVVCGWYDGRSGGSA